MMTSQIPQTRRRAREEAPGVTVPPSRAPSIGEPSRPPSLVAHDDREQPKQTQRHKYKNPYRKEQHPQITVTQFWSNFSSRHPGKPYSVLPDNLYAKRAAAHAPKGVKNALASYDEARAACEAKVAKIVKECRRTNQKYRDPHFDIEADFRRWGQERPFSDCLMGLLEERTELRPASVKRVEDIFEDPRFFIEGATANDVRQGKEGDCWFMSALCTLSNKENLIQNICVARDEKVGVYGFVFHRDGEWISEVIDDKLYLIKEDFNDATLERNKWLELQNRTSPEEEYRTVMQTGSRALYFAQCSDPNETWLPLLEKAFAKAHGDYWALESGFVGEGIEDLTGGVTTELFSTDILDKDKFWKEELMNVNKEFLFGCGQMGGKYGERNGILEKHAYSIMEAREVNGLRLLKLRNPWGNTEWRGAWADGSSQWTPKWMELLDHKFGDDGVFWISYQDLLRNYQHFDRTRLFGKEWTVTQQWTSLNVPWSVDYLDTMFKIALNKKSEVIIVLSQLDDRYFRGLEGQYEFQLQFRVHKDDEDEDAYIVRSNQSYYMKRSVSTELELEAGNYTVVLKIIGKRYHDDPTVEEVIAKTCQFRREKLLSIGLSYDLAHAKGMFTELEAEMKEEAQLERRKKRKAIAMQMHAARVKQHKKQKLRAIRMNMRKEAKAMRKMVERADEQAREAVDTSKVDKKMGEFQFQEPDQISGLGIVNGNGTDPLTKEFVAKSVSRVDTGERPKTPPTRQSTGSSTRRDTRPLSRSISSRPGSPFMMGSASHRRDTLTIDRPVPIHSPSYGMPGIQVHRASMTEGGQLSLSDISDDDLSWDDELDAPENSDEEEDQNTREYSMFSTSGRGPSRKPEGENECGEDPWNAVCVVGLRVFSKDTDLKIEVVRRTGEERDVNEERQDYRRGLDVDDANKDPSREPVSPISPARGPGTESHADKSLRDAMMRYSIGEILTG